MQRTLHAATIDGPLLLCTLSGRGAPGKRRLILFVTRFRSACKPGRRFGNVSHRKPLMDQGCGSPA
jgi:hypothetical protein